MAGGTGSRPAGAPTREQSMAALANFDASTYSPGAPMAGRPTGMFGGANSEENAAAKLAALGMGSPAAAPQSQMPSQAQMQASVRPGMAMPSYSPGGMQRPAPMQPPAPMINRAPFNARRYANPAYAAPRQAPQFQPQLTPNTQAAAQGAQPAQGTPSDYEQMRRELDDLRAMQARYSGGGN